MERTPYKPTNWEKQILDCGHSIITWDHKAIMDYLISIYERDKNDLLLKAAMDETKRHEIGYTLNFGDFDTNFGGSVYYNKKLRKFTHIEYSDRYNWMVQFSIMSRATFSARDFYNQWKLLFPFGASIKVMREFMLNN